MVASSLILNQAPGDSGRGSSRRRLITLIFVDRAQALAIMVVIRRELPRTRVAGPARKACRIGAHEDSPLPCAIPAADPWCLYRVHDDSLVTSGGPLERARWSVGCGALGRYTDGPNEAEQLPAHRGNDLLFRLASGQQLRIAGVQAVLRFPGDRLDLLALIALPSAQGGTDARTVPIGPGRFDHDPAQVRVAGFADRTALDPRPARVLSRSDAAVAHQLPRLRKARQFPDLGHDRYCADLGDSAQALQRLDHCTHLHRQRLD